MADLVLKSLPNILLGNYSLMKIGGELAPLGSSFMIIIDPILQGTAVAETVISSLEKKGVSVFTFDETDYTVDVETIEHALSLARAAHIDGVISLGSIVPASVARAVAVLYNETESVYKFLDGFPCSQPPIPLIQIPATCRDPFIFSATTPVLDSRSGTVVMLNKPESVCKLCIFDPECYANIGPNAVSAMILRGLNLSFEGWISLKANFFSDTLLKKAIERFLVALYDRADNFGAMAREEIIAEAACLSAIGMAATAPGLATATALSFAGKFKQSGIMVTSVLFPYLVGYAVSANLDKVLKLAELLEIDTEGLDSPAIAQSTVDELRMLIAQAHLPTRLKDINISIEQLIPIAENTVKLQFVNYIPRPMTKHELFEFLKQAY